MSIHQQQRRLRLNLTAVNDGSPFQGVPSTPDICNRTQYFSSPPAAIVPETANISTPSVSSFNEQRIQSLPRTFVFVACSCCEQRCVLLPLTATQSFALCIAL